uniref:Pyridoxamine 5'-phosphate oxidase Alr4036 family FMN-binding domain-containing protein n=1 Tax=Rhodosorus marinus TaxID=101924 RepID=A0A7S2ZQW3_9RHOD|mmetsp:Transcript_29096/g.113067  ORF Transcript_29096/g.113067 Transcript_29096/m.113067 type:complete len:199 (+) Transcript_29096:225-821(+)|eukprot:CAMPEP_0113958536 /NCGR_PEP_ID=MMETSP0011_2-20120614/3505_1 /TAXON_ID=101924 /ORGANISM="Rhodosorus marinus" /LENGTH=198 /DNA_ID=CAMNT_0000969471 /DNA_START=46 /DNA_END=642 /DNA_ORIENTATION=+ /assembly_acc=CAM_ASM_000156
METSPEWINLLTKALNRNRKLPYARYLSLATVTEEGKPSCRTVVYRGILEGTLTTLKVITDVRSEKIKHLKKNNWVEACWYMPETREQFRIQGLAHAVVASDEDAKMQDHRIRQWKQLSDAARSSFADPHPGIPKDPDWTGKKSGDGVDPSIPHENFVLLIIDPKCVDYLNLRPNPQLRAYYTLEEEKGSWNCTEVYA